MVRTQLLRSILIGAILALVFVVAVSYLAESGAFVGTWVDRLAD